MKIPDKAEWFSQPFGGGLYDSWRDVAQKIGMATGVYVSVGYELYVTPTPDPDGSYIKRMYFMVMDHEFEGLDDLKKALDNKAFL